MPPITPVLFKANLKTMFHNTSDNSVEEPSANLYIFLNHLLEILNKEKLQSRNIRRIHQDFLLFKKKIQKSSSWLSSNKLKS